jgi:hypothetical protein
MPVSIVSQYNLTAVPFPLAHMHGLKIEGPEVKELEGQTKWSGAMGVPAIGDRVEIKFNSFGRGTVMGYFIEHDYLGLYVKVDKLPEWRVKQDKRNGKRSPESIAANPLNCVMVFGAEIHELNNPIEG